LDNEELAETKSLGVMLEKGSHTTGREVFRSGPCTWHCCRPETPEYRFFRVPHEWRGGPSAYVGEIMWHRMRFGKKNESLSGDTVGRRFATLDSLIRNRGEGPWRCQAITAPPGLTGASSDRAMSTTARAKPAQDSISPTETELMRPARFETVARREV